MRLLTACLLLVVLLAAVPSVWAQGGSHIYVPRLALDQQLISIPIVDRAWDTSGLRGDSGWLEGTNAATDGWGRVVLVGHSYGSFARLADVQVGDMVVMWDDGWVVRYSVVEKRVVPVTETSVTWPTREPSIALLTCHGNDRLVIIGRRLDD